MKRLLSTKILPELLQARLRASGWELTQYDAISIELLPVVFRPGEEIAIFTSKHAVRACLSGNRDRTLSGLSCLCVGTTTASLIGRHGGKVLACAPSATELGSLISNEYTDRSFIYFCGNRRLDIIPEILDKLSLEWQEIIAYETKTVQKSFDQSFEAILFFSPSGVESFASTNAIGAATAYCIGPTTASEAKKHTNKYKIPESPDVKALVDLVIHTINTVKN